MPHAIAASARWRPMERVELWNLAFKILSSLCPKNGLQLSPAASAVPAWDEHAARQSAVHEERLKISPSFREGPDAAASADRRKGTVLAANLCVVRCKLCFPA